MLILSAIAASLSSWNLGVKEPSFALDSLGFLTFFFLMILLRFDETPLSLISTPIAGRPCQETFPSSCSYKFSNILSYLLDLGDCCKVY